MDSKLDEGILTWSVTGIEPLTVRYRDYTVTMWEFHTIFFCIVTELSWNKYCLNQPLSHRLQSSDWMRDRVFTYLSAAPAVAEVLCRQLRRHVDPPPQRTGTGGAWSWDEGTQLPRGAVVAGNDPITLCHQVCGQNTYIYIDRMLGHVVQL